MLTVILIENYTISLLPIFCTNITKIKKKENSDENENRNDKGVH